MNLTDDAAEIPFFASLTRARSDNPFALGTLRIINLTRNMSVDDEIVMTRGERLQSSAAGRRSSRTDVARRENAERMDPWNLLVVAHRIGQPIKCFGRVCHAVARGQDA